MFQKSYSNFVKASFPTQCSNAKQNDKTIINGVEAQKLYLEIVRNAKASVHESAKQTNALKNRREIVINEEVPLSNKDLFVSVENNNVDTLKYILDKYPSKINIVDNYGWSLLMIACQANSVEAVKFLLTRGVNMSIRDKAGNSARSLVVKNRNFVLADVLLSYKQKDTLTNSKQAKYNVKSENFVCEICNKTFADREEHLSSTIHNISASKGKKIPAHYILPESNKGYQLMLKGGWDKQSGLGRDGTGKLYPIKTVQKKDRKGLGHEKPKCEDKSVEDNVKHKNRKKVARDHHNDKSFEINFRRQFY